MTERRSPYGSPLYYQDARDVIAQCAAEGVPVLHKHNGEFDESSVRVGKTKAGRQLDGETHDGYPEVEVAQ